MPETSREFIVSLLDDTNFTVPVKSTLLGSELLDMAASHMKVKEKEYFGLYTDGEGYKNWIELDKPVLDPSQDLIKGTGPVTVHFAFKYFVDDTRALQDHMTVELLYLQSRQAIVKGDILTDEATVFELAACAMQAQCGDYRSEQEARQQLNLLPVLPVFMFQNHSVHYCEDEVIHYYRMMHTLSRGEAILKYLEIILTLPMYSVHFFEDKKDTPLWLGVGPDGISQCRHNDQNEAEMRFQWLQLQNIYYRDRKFSMEVYQNTRPGKKMGLGPVHVFAWYASNSKVVMAIWKMARDQHMFYRSKRTNRSAAVTNLTEIIRQLNKLHRSNVSPSSSHSSLSVESAKSNQAQASAEAVAAAKAAQQEMYTALLSKRQALVADFEGKAARYKEILIKEMQITGIPPEGLTADEIEKMRKKFGVSFKFSKFVLDDSLADESEVEQLEKQLEIQSSIIEASKTLLIQANSRKLKKDRKKEIKEMENRYQRLEEKLMEMKRSSRTSVTSTGSSKFHVESPTSSVMNIPGSAPSFRRRSGTPGGASIDDTFLANMIFDTPSKSNSQNSSLQKSPHHKSTSALNDVSTSTPSQTHTHTASHSHASHQSFDHAFGTDHDSPSYLATLTSGYADEFDSSPTSSIVSGQSGVFSKQANRHSNQALRDFDLTEDFLQHLSLKDPGQPQSRRDPVHSSPLRGHAIDIPVSSSPVTRYKRASSPNLISHDKLRYRSSSPLPEFEQHASSYHPPSQLHRPPQGHQPHNTHRPQNTSLKPQNMLYDNEVALKSYSRPAAQGSKIPVPVSQRPAKNTSESYDLHEMLQVWEKSSSNPFGAGEGTLV